MKFFLLFFILLATLNTTNVSAQNVNYSCEVPTSFMRLGSRDQNTNGDVSRLQIFLKQHLSLNDSQLLVSGIYGRISENFVKEFQRRNGLIVTGLVGGPSRKIIANFCTGNASDGNTWIGTSWSQCVNGLQVRGLICNNSQGQQVSDRFCTGQKPATYQTCTVTNLCTPLPSENRTLSCPSGQTGTITQNRVSTCSANGTTPVWSSWATTTSTCVVTPSEEFVQDSVRMNRSDASYFSRSFTGNPRTWTFSTWVKRTNPAEHTQLLGINSNDNPHETFGFHPSGRLHFMSYGPGGNSYKFNSVTANTFTRTDVWYHVTLVWNSASAVETERIKIFVDGVQQALVNGGSVGIGSGANSFILYPTQDQSTVINSGSSGPYRIGKYYSGYADSYMNGYLADTYFIDGQALDALSFAENRNGNWSPKVYTGTFGATGAHLDYSSVSLLGNDESGNNNHWTANGLDPADQMRDTPIRNFAVLDPTSCTGGSVTNGNLGFSNSNSSNYFHCRANMGITTKTYWEMSHTAGIKMRSGIVKLNGFPAPGGVDANTLGGNSSSYAVRYSGTTLRNNNADVATGLTTTRAGDTAMWAYDPSTGKLWYGVNGVWHNSGDPGSGLGQTATIDNTSTWYPAVNSVEGGAGLLNFGQGGQTGIINNPESGGRFRYTPPLGFKGLYQQF